MVHSPGALAHEGDVDRRRRRRSLGACAATHAVVLTLALGGVATAVPEVQRHDDVVDEFLRQRLGFPAHDLETVGEGGSAVRSLPSDDSHDIATAGVVGLTVTPSAFVEHLRDIEHFKSDAAVLQIGKFGPTPRLDDVERLVLEPDDLHAFRNCRLGDCDVRLTADAIRSLRADVDWSSPDHDLQALRFARRYLVQISASYLESGDTTLQDLRDRDRPVNPRDQFRKLIAASPSPLELVPEFRQYLLDFPRQRLPGVENFLYWSKERLAFHAVVSVTHVAIYTPPIPSPFAVVIASRQVYASRYFDASLGLTSMFRVTRPESIGRYDLLYVNRSRSDELGGFFGGLKRAIVRSKTRTAMHKYLALLQQRLAN